MGNDGNGFGREKILDGKKMGVRICVKVFVCGDGFEKKNLFAVTSETGLTGTEGAVEERKKMKKVAKTGIQ